MMRSWTRRNGSNPLGSLSLHPRCGKIRADVNRQIIQDSPYGRGRSAFEILVWFRLGRLRDEVERRFRRITEFEGRSGILSTAVALIIAHLGEGKVGDLVVNAMNKALTDAGLN